LIMRRVYTILSAAGIVAATALTGTAQAQPFPDVIVLPGATSAEGIAIGAGSTFYAGDLVQGDIYRGDLRSGSASLFIDAPAGRMAVGMAADTRHDLLAVAGGATGMGFFYDTATGADVAAVALIDPAQGTFVNDVTVTRDAAWFTDSVHPHLYRVPIAPDGSVGAASTLVLTGPAANLSGDFNLNGIAATPNGKTLIVAHSSDETLYTVDPATGASAPIAGAELPAVDGILLEAGRVWAVQNFLNQVTELRLSPDLSSATVENVITHPAFQVPTTIARHGSRLALVNAKFDTGVPPTAGQHEVVVVNR
jgi:sugar lactone lactonase YvrE